MTLLENLSAGRMRKKGLPTVREFLRLRWRPLSEQPLIEPPRFSPIIADPTFVPGALPQLSPDTLCPWMNLGAGAIKVIRLRDGYVCLQNGIYTDNRGNSGSAIYAIPSRDGRRWHSQNARCVLAPDPEYAWRASHVYALDCRYVAREQRWYLFFNGRTTAHWSRGREAIGALYA
ncbi:MAG: hypothetical protein OHK0011_24150 [Turneriella sp.]